jgi:hypothetical protein
MTKRKQIKYIHEGKYVAEVEVELISAKDEWAPYLSIQDAYTLDDVREALRRGDLKSAAQKARLFTLQPIAI